MRVKGIPIFYKITIKWPDVYRIEYRKQRVAAKLSILFVAIASVFGGLIGTADDAHPILYGLFGVAFYPIIYWFVKDWLFGSAAKFWTVLYYTQTL